MPPRLLCCFVACAFITPAYAQNYPAKPVRLIVPWPAGGTTDILGRVIGQKLNEMWGQPVVIENRGGAAGNIGTELVVKAPPRFSITTAWPHISFSFCPMTRPSMSVVPPAGHGTIRRTGLAG